MRPGYGQARMPCRRALALSPTQLGSPGLPVYPPSGSRLKVLREARAPSTKRSTEMSESKSD